MMQAVRIKEIPKLNIYPESTNQEENDSDISEFLKPEVSQFYSYYVT